MPDAMRRIAAGDRGRVSHLGSSRVERAPVRRRGPRSRSSSARRRPTTPPRPRHGPPPARRLARWTAAQPTRASPPTLGTFTRPAARPRPPGWWSPPSPAAPAASSAPSPTPPGASNAGPSPATSWLDTEFEVYFHVRVLFRTTPPKHNDGVERVRARGLTRAPNAGAGSLRLGRTQAPAPIRERVSVPQTRFTRQGLHLADRAPPVLDHPLEGKVRLRIAPESRAGRSVILAAPRGDEDLHVAVPPPSCKPCGLRKPISVSRLTG